MNLKDKTVVDDNKTYRYSKIVMLECDKSFLYLHCGKLYNNRTTMHIPDGKQLTQRLYFLSTDKICKGDWYYSEIHNQIFKCIHDEQYFENEFKVIASTDPSLNLPKPSDSFLQIYIDCFNKNEKIKECLVEYEGIGRMKSGGEYCPIIYVPKVTKGEITIRKVKDSWSREEVVKLCQKCWLKQPNTENILEEFNNWISKNL